MTGILESPRTSFRLLALIVSVAILCTGCGPKSSDAELEPCRMSPWGEKMLAELAEDKRFPQIPDSLGSVEEELQRFRDNGQIEADRVRVGAAYFREEKYEDALQFLTYEFENTRIEAIAGMFLGFIHIRRHEYVKGADHLQLITSNPSSGDNLLYLMTCVALIYSEHCMHQQAIPQIERLLEAEPEDIYMWVQLGWNYGGIGEYDKAREVFTKTRQLVAGGVTGDVRDKGELEAYSGFVEWNAGNTQAAKRYFEEAMKSPHAPPSTRHALDALNAGKEPFYARW